VQRSSRKERLRHYGSPTPEETVIRGHKLYWHKGDVDRAFIEDKEFRGQSHLPNDDTQHTVIKPVRSGVRFQFKIHFENASAEELGALLWLLDIAADKDYRLKLGMAKPLGLGAVSVDSALHLTERKARYTRLFDGDAWATGDEDDPQTVWDEAVEAFETWLLKHRDLNPSHKSSVAELTRIQMLLALLSWPGPDRENTRYLEIEHPQHGNEYRSRRVLPTPLAILQRTQPVKQSKQPETKPQSSGDWQKGRVKWFNDAKGYGFIAVDNSNQEIFVHYSDIQGTGHRSLSEGQSVRFTIAQGDRGPKAKNVEKL
jgi:cold shock CspA family protein